MPTSESSKRHEWPITVRAVRRETPDIAALRRAFHLSAKARCERNQSGDSKPDATEDSVHGE